jgi:hypothetical protein
MKNLSILALAAGILLLSSCGKPSPGTTGTPSMKPTDWGLIEIAAGSPKHLRLYGRDCTLTATPLPDGNVALLIEIEALVRNPPAAGPHETTVYSMTQKIVVPANRECTCDIDYKPVRFTLKLKAST